jgi:Cdc6-like AAA superfamily ATPase
LVSESPYYIDQNLFQIQGHDNKWEETNLGLSLSYFSDLFRPDYESDNVSNPISVILGSGGMGKTTLCDKLVNTINNYDKKKAIYINAQDLISNLIV